MTRHEVLSRAFPGLPTKGYYALVDGDLQRLLPDWSDRLTRYFTEAAGDGFPTGIAVERGLTTAWERVFADYDEADAADLARERAAEAEARRIDGIVHAAVVRQQIAREMNEQPELL